MPQPPECAQALHAPAVALASKPALSRANKKLKRGSERVCRQNLCGEGGATAEQGRGGQEAQVREVLAVVATLGKPLVRGDDGVSARGGPRTRGTGGEQGCEGRRQAEEVESFEFEIFSRCNACAGTDVLGRGVVGEVSATAGVGVGEGVSVGNVGARAEEEREQVQELGQEVGRRGAGAEEVQDVDFEEIPWNLMTVGSYIHTYLPGT